MSARTFAAIFTLACFVGAWDAQYATPGDDKVEIKELGLSLPATVSGIKFQKRQAFDEKALGFSLAYGNERCAITLIVYDLGVKDIPDGKAGPHVAEQMRRSIKDLQTAAMQGLFKNLQAMKGDLPLPKPALETFATAGYLFDVPGGSCKSYILLTGRNKHFLKVRVTQYIVEQKTNDAEIKEFLESLTKAVSGR